MTPEGEVKAALRAQLTSWRAWAYPVVPTGYGRRGIPDIIACVPALIRPEHVGQWIGLFAGIEAKVHPKVADTWQVREISAIKNASGLAGVCYNDQELRELFNGWRS